LGDSAALRAKMGAAARRTVEERYCTEVVAASFAHAIKSSLGVNGSTATAE
jgi:hypothetical protein